MDTFQQTDYHNISLFVFYQSRRTEANTFRMNEKARWISLKEGFINVSTFHRNMGRPRAAERITLANE